jgi:4-amino-4-deoxy-L-arabinose transferase-like glycosyltransferase
MEKLGFCGLWILIAYSVVRNLFAAAATRFWCDEVWTAIMARQFSASQIWHALSLAVDGQPPPFYFVERVAVGLMPNIQVALRLPSIFAFAGTLLCVFIFVRMRSGALIALVCAAILLLTVLFDPYATDGRPYSMVVACIAFALVCYQRAPDTRWVILMGLSLMAAEALHYYALFAFVPFGIAEIAQTLKIHRVRPGIWLALACALLPLAIFWPLLRALKQTYGVHLWAQSNLRHVGSTYGWFFHILWFYVNGALAAAVVFLLLSALLVLALPRSRRAWMAEPFFHEHVLTVTLLALPFVAYAATKLAYSGMDHRYVLPAALAIPLGAGFVLPRLSRSATLLSAILILLLLIAQETRFWPSRRNQMTQFVPPVDSIERMVNVADLAELPVVVSDGVDYSPIVYYASSELAERFVFLVDPSVATAYIETDSIDIGLLAESSLYPAFQVYQFRDFATEHPSFLLYSNGSHYDWWPRRLRDDGYTLQVVAAEGGGKIYLVSR